MSDLLGEALEQPINKPAHWPSETVEDYDERVLAWLRGREVERAAARAFHALTNRGFVVDEAEVGYCRKHDDVARRYGDGSWSCWWESTVEANGYHDDSDFVRLVDALSDTPTPEDTR